MSLFFYFLLYDDNVWFLPSCLCLILSLSLSLSLSLLFPLPLTLSSSFNRSCKMSTVCSGYGKETILYAWAKAAPGFNYPKGIYYSYH